MEQIFFKLPAGLRESLLKYLVKQPFEEVAAGVAALERLEVLKPEAQTGEADTFLAKEE
jgi:hypothetical protein